MRRLYQIVMTLSLGDWLRSCEFAQAAGRSRCALKDKFQALNVRKVHKRSTGNQLFGNDVDVTMSFSLRLFTLPIYA